jgi:hypothetical protein
MSTANEENARRIDRAAKAIWAGEYLQDHPKDHETAVRDLLSDLRHYCDCYAVDFGNEDRIAHSNYLAELEGNDE